MNKAGTDGPSTRKEQNVNKSGAGQENKTGTKREQTVVEEQTVNKTGTIIHARNKTGTIIHARNKTGTIMPHRNKPGTRFQLRSE